MSSFLQLFAAMFIEMPKHGSLFERLQVFPKSMIFPAFSRNEALFAENFIEMQRHASLFQKLQSFDQIDDFSCFFTKWGTFCNFFLKNWWKCKDMVLCSKSCKVLAKSMVFWTNYHVLVFRWTFQPKVEKSGWIREKAGKMIDLAKTLQLFEQTTMSLHFHQLFRKTLQKVPHFVKKNEKSSFGQIFATFRTNYHVFAFRWTLQGKVAKSASFREKAWKTIDFAKTCNISRKLPCLGIFMNLSARRCKKCLISWKSTRNHRFGQNYATFRKNYHVFAFRLTFKKKVRKSGSFREKARKIMDLVKTCNFLNKLPCLCISMNF